MLRIGEVVRRLSDEFPDISISKIRFLEDEGLLAPQRTREALPRDGRRRGGGLRPADALRRRRAPPAHLPDRDRPRGGAARAARRTGLALAQRRTPRRRAARPAGTHRARAGAERAAPLARGPRRGQRVKRAFLGRRWERSRASGARLRRAVAKA